MYKRSILGAAGVMTAMVSASPALAGHMFTQGSTNTPVWLQTGQSIFIEQFYSEETDTPGRYSIYFDYDSNNIPSGADNSTTAWADFDAGDVIKLTLMGPSGAQSYTFAYDSDANCTYTVCGYTGSTYLSGADIADFGGFGTYLPTITAIDSNTDGSLSAAEVAAAGAAGMGSLAPVFFFDMSNLMDTQYANDLDSSGTIDDSERRLDADGSGAVSQQELDDFANTYYWSNGPLNSGENNTNDLMTALDSNTDGSLSQTELNGMAALVFANFDADSDGQLTELELGTAMFDYQTWYAFAYGTDGATGVLNGYGLTFEALAGQFSLGGYRIADTNGFQLHGSGSGPVDQSMVGGGGASVPATMVSIVQSATVTEQAMSQVQQVLIGAAEQEVDVNFSDLSSGPSVSSKGLNVSTSNHASRFAVRTEGMFDTNKELGDTRTGSFVIAYALQPELDLGVYSTRRNTELSYDGFGFEGYMTTIGAYLRNRPQDGLGMQWKVSLGGALGSATITRSDALTGAEAGTGAADMTGKVVSAELGYGLKLGETLVTPFTRLSYSEVERGAYSERNNVAAPLSFDAYSQRLMTLVAGVDGERQLTANDRVSGSLFVAHDLYEDADNVSGSSAIAGLSDFDFLSPEAKNQTRVGANLMYYRTIGEATRLYTRASVQMASHSDEPTYGLGIGLETRF